MCLNIAALRLKSMTCTFRVPHAIHLATTSPKCYMHTCKNVCTLIRMEKDKYCIKFFVGFSYNQSAVKSIVSKASERSRKHLKFI